MLWFSAHLGAFAQKLRPLKEEERAVFGIVQAAIFTLLGLLIGFTLSVAIDMFDQRRSYEVAEANAVRTEYLRADLLADPDAARVRELLRNYLSQRILFYTVRDVAQLRQIDASSFHLQGELWSAVQARSGVLPAVVDLTVSGP